MKVEFKNRSALRGKVIEKFGSIQKFAEAMDYSYTGIRNLIGGQVRWTIELARKACIVLGMENDPQEIYRIFFTD